MPNAQLPRPLYHHRQNSRVDCGRACAQMVIGYVIDGLGSGAAPLVQQEDLAAAETGKYLNWETDPVELTDLINTEIAKVASVRWSLAQFATGGNVPTAVDSMLSEVRSCVDRGYPAVISKSASDHWVVVWGYEYNTAGNLVLYQADPLAAGAIGMPFPHTQTDTCPQVHYTVDVVIVGSSYFVVNAAPFNDQAITVVVPELGVGALAGALTKYLRTIPRWWKGPPPPPLDWIQPREVSIRVVMQGWYDAFAGLVHSLAEFPHKEIVREVEGRAGSVRYIRPIEGERSPFLLTAVVSSTNAGLLIMFDHQGNVQGFAVTDASFASSLAVDDPIAAEDLVYLPRYGEYQPFAKRTDNAGRAVLLRLHDGLIVPEVERP